MINILNCQWVMTTEPKKGICNITTPMNVKLLAKRLQIAGNQDYRESFIYNRINSKTPEFAVLPVIDYNIDESSCYIKFEGNIGVVEILGMEQ